MTKGYQNYRGRGSRSHKLGIVLLALVLAAACVYLLAQRYITYTDDGGMRLDLPFLSRQKDPGETAGEPKTAAAGEESPDTGRPETTGGFPDPAGVPAGRLVRLTARRSGGGGPERCRQNEQKPPT